MPEPEEKCETHNKYFFEHSDEEKEEDMVQTGVTVTATPEGAEKEKEKAKKDDEQFSGPESDWVKYVPTQPAMASASWKIKGKRISEPTVDIELTFSSMEDAIKVLKSLKAFGITDLVLTTFDATHTPASKMFIERYGSDKFAKFLSLYDDYVKEKITAQMIARELGVTRYEVELLLNDMRSIFQ